MGIHDSGGVRAWLAAGARFGLVRRVPREPEGRSWQLSFEAGLGAQYDSKRKHDNIGYDGIYGLVLTTADAGPLWPSSSASFTPRATSGTSTWTARAETEAWISVGLWLDI